MSLTANMKNIVALICLLIAFAPISRSQPPGGGPPQTSSSEICGITLSSRSLSGTINSTDRVISTNDCPGYDWTLNAPNNATVLKLSFTLPLSPVISNTKIYVGIEGAGGVTNDAIKGFIGVAINGVLIYSNADANNLDAVVNEGMSFDKCGGHADPNGNYHYHMEPTAGCVYNDTTGQHSPLFGFMMDGIPIYGSLGDNGVAPTNLDECGGHTDTSYAFYHYHLTANMAFPYTISCLTGCVFSSNGNSDLEADVTTSTTCSEATTQYDYSSLNNAMLISKEQGRLSLSILLMFILFVFYVMN